MISINAHAKINLSLDVLSKRDDGYHNLEMIMQTIQLHDTVVVREISTGIEIKCDAPYVPNNSTNIAYKAAELIINKYKLDAGVSIYIQKNIPVAAGLAGGSTNAAAVLKAINNIFKLNISLDELMQIGKEIGADVPYCIMGGTALAEGIGEKLTPLSSIGNVPILLIKPRIGVSTAWVYKSLNLEEVMERPNTQLLISALNNVNLKFIAENMSNVLESVTIKKYPIIDSIKKELINKGAVGSMMSGSGPTVFGIFDDEEKAKNAFASYENSENECILTYTI